MVGLPKHLNEIHAVNAAYTVEDYIEEFKVALYMEGLATGNPNKGKPGAGRFDFCNIAVERAMRGEKFTRAIGVLTANRANSSIQKLLDRLYELAPQLQEAYQ
jgi:hypothetical protein